MVCESSASREFHWPHYIKYQNNQVIMEAGMSLHTYIYLYVYSSYFLIQLQMLSQTTCQMVLIIITGH